MIEDVELGSDVIEVKNNDKFVGASVRYLYWSKGVSSLVLSLLSLVLSLLSLQVQGKKREGSCEF